MDAPEAFSYLIIGAGVFGASTALHLKRSQPTCHVQLMDRGAPPCPSAASHDLNKIVRADYEDLFYMKLALESMHEWRSNPIYRQFYRESGILIINDSGWGQRCLENYKLLQAETKAEILSRKTALERFPVFSEADWDGAEECYLNPGSGWAEADKALDSCLKAAREAGVEVSSALIDKLLLDNDNRCVGAKAVDGTEYRSGHVLLCTGAYTPKLLLDTFPQAEEMQLGDRMCAAGSVSCSASFDVSDLQKLDGVPVLINTMPSTHGESVPPLSNGLLKFNNEPSFTCNTLHPESGKTVSIPPKRVSQSTWSQDIPRQLKDEASTVVRHTYGNALKDLKVEQYRICWDAVTPTQDWLIAPHPKITSLYIAAGGSFHSWKFLPVIGGQVARMLRGEFKDGTEERKKWGWNKGGDDTGACPMYWPTRDLADLSTKG